MAPSISLCVPCHPKHVVFLPGLVYNARLQLVHPLELIVGLSETAPDEASKLERDLQKIFEKTRIVSTLCNKVRDLIATWPRRQPWGKSLRSWTRTT